MRPGSWSIGVLGPWAAVGEQWLGWAPYKSVRCWMNDPHRARRKRGAACPFSPR